MAVLEDLAEEAPRGNSKWLNLAELEAASKVRDLKEVEEAATEAREEDDDSPMMVLEEADSKEEAEEAAVEEVAERSWTMTPSTKTSRTTTSKERERMLVSLEQSHGVYSKGYP